MPSYNREMVAFLVAIVIALVGAVILVFALGNETDRKQARCEDGAGIVVEVQGVDTGGDTGGWVCIPNRLPEKPQ